MDYKFPKKKVLQLTTNFAQVSKPGFLKEKAKAKQKEKEWRKMKASYENYINSLKNEKEKDSKQGLDHENENAPPKLFGFNGTKSEGRLVDSSSEDLSFVNQTKAVLLAELASMELFYGMEDLIQDHSNGRKGAFFSNKKLGTTANRDLLLQSAETLLELTEYFFAAKPLNESLSSDEEDPMRTQSNSGTTGKKEAPKRKISSYQKKLLRVRELLKRLKTTTDSSTVKLLSQILTENAGNDKEVLKQGKRDLQCRLREFLAEQDKLKGCKQVNSVDLTRLEQCLCHVLMDKALTNCLLLLDKAEMEKELKRLLEAHPTTDTKGVGQPLTVICPKHCAHEGFHLKGDGRLVSIDEGVVLDSPSGGSISPGALTSSSQTSLCSASGKSQTAVACGGESSPLAEQSEVVLRKENNVLKATLEEKEKERDEIERKLREQELLITNLQHCKLNEEEVLHKKLLDAQNQTEIYRQENAILQEKLNELEHRFAAVKKSEKKLRAEICFDMEKKLVKSEDSNKMLQKKVWSLEKALSGSSLSSLESPHHCDRDQLALELSDAASQNARLSITAVDLQELLRESEEKIAAMEENEFLLREEIFAEANTKVEELETMNFNLNKRIQELEGELLESGRIVVQSKKFIEKMSHENQALTEDLRKRVQELEGELNQNETNKTLVRQYEEKLRNAEKDSKNLSAKILKVEQKMKRILSVDGRQNMLSETAIEELQLLRDKLEKTEKEKLHLEAHVASIDKQFKETQKMFVSMRNYEIGLESDLSELKSKLGASEEKAFNSFDKEYVDNSEKDKLYDLRMKNISMAVELRHFREHSYSMESQLFLKDQEIMCLKNEVVDLMSEISKLDVQLNELLNEKLELESKMVENVDSRVQLEWEMSAIQEEKSRVSTQLIFLLKENNALKDLLQKAGIKTEISSQQQDTLSKDCEIALERIASRQEEENTKSQTQMELKEITISQLQAKMDELTAEKRKLDSFIVTMSKKNKEVIDENKSLVDDIKLFEAKLSSLQNELSTCSKEKEKLLSEVSLRFAENESIKAFASLCTEETEILKTQLTIQQVAGDEMEKRIEELQRNATVMQKQVDKLTLEKTSLEDEKVFLQKRVHNASQVIDRVKEELFGLMKTVLSLQRELIRLVDKIMSSLEIDEELPGLPPKMHEMLPRSRPRLFSDDSGYLSCNAHDNVSDITSSASSEASAESLISTNIQPDEDSLINPSDISVIRENKSEIFRMHEELRAKLVAIRDAVSRLSPKSVDSLPDLSGHGYSSDTEMFNKLLNSSDRLRSKILPFSSRAERMKLNGILSLFKETEFDKEGVVCKEDHDIFNFYVTLEEKLSNLSNELSRKESEISKLLQEKERLQNEMTRCGRCGFAKEKVMAEEAKEKASGDLMACVDETTNLETELLTLVQYKTKLAKDLETVKKEIGEMEGELGISQRSEELSSRLQSKELVEEGLPSKPKEKHVTFGSVEHNIITLPTGKDSLSSDLSGSNIDLVALLASLPLEKPIDPKLLQERQEMEDQAHRLSNYDNFPFEEKVDFVIQKKLEAEISARPRPPSPRRKIENENRDDSEPMTCKMCAFSGLFRSMRSKNKIYVDDAYTKNT